MAFFRVLFESSPNPSYGSSGSPRHEEANHQAPQCATVILIVRIDVSEKSASGSAEDTTNHAKTPHAFPEIHCYPSSIVFAPNAELGSGTATLDAFYGFAPCAESAPAPPIQLIRACGNQKQR
jgi:hypothetical protein